MTERQIQASRANGAKSRGPVTAEGKYNSAYNAFRHGMLSDTIVLKGEAPDRFLTLITNLYEEFEPQTEFETELVETMASARWRLLRLWSMERHNMDEEMALQAGLPGVDRQPVNLATRAFRTLSDSGRSLDLINRYETRYERQYFRAHRRLVEVQDRRIPPAYSPDLQPPAPELPSTDPATAPAPEVEISERTPEVPENKEAAAENKRTPARPRTYATFVKRNGPAAARRKIARHLAAMARAA